MKRAKLPFTTKAYYWLIALGVLLFNNTHAADLDKVHSFGSNPGNLEMFMHSPTLPATTVRPVVFVLHGCYQNARGVMEITGWNKLSDHYGFYVVYPQTKVTNNPTQCYNWFRTGDIERGKGECESIKEMLDYMKQHYAIDTTQVFITGVSAGAAMSVSMMAVYPELFNGGAIFAGGPYKLATNVLKATGAMAGWSNKTPAEWGELVRRQNPGYQGTYPKIIIYQGTADPVVNRNNADELVKQWTNLHGIDDVTPIIDTNTAHPEITGSHYYNKQGNEVVTCYRIRGLGHALLNNPGPCLNQGGEAGAFATDINFHSTWQVAQQFGLTGNWNITGPGELRSGQVAQFSISDSGYTHYRWQLPRAASVITGAGTKAIAIKWGTQTAAVGLEVSTKEGCKYSYNTLNVTVAKDTALCTILIPNALAQENSTLSYHCNCKVTAFHFILYNRWGAAVYETNSTANPTTLDAFELVNGGGKKEYRYPAGTYFYKLTFETEGTKPLEKTGTLVIIN